jgi:hypothetical protein
VLYIGDADRRAHEVRGHAERGFDRNPKEVRPRLGKALDSKIEHCILMVETQNLELRHSDKAKCHEHVFVPGDSRLPTGISSTFKEVKGRQKFRTIELARAVAFEPKCDDFGVVKGWPPSENRDHLLRV